MVSTGEGCAASTLPRYCHSRSVSAGCGKTVNRSTRRRWIVTTRSDQVAATSGYEDKLHWPRISCQCLQDNFRQDRAPPVAGRKHSRFLPFLPRVCRYCEERVPSNDEQRSLLSIDIQFNSKPKSKQHSTAQDESIGIGQSRKTNQNSLEKPVAYRILG